MYTYFQTKLKMISALVPSAEPTQSIFPCLSTGLSDGEQKYSAPNTAAPNIALRALTFHHLAHERVLYLQ